MTKKRGLRGKGNAGRTLKELKNAQPDMLIKIGELSLLVEVKASTLKYYSEIGLLPHEQTSKGGNRLYHKGNAMEQMTYIQLQKMDRKTIEEIKEAINKKEKKMKTNKRVKTKH